MRSVSEISWALTTKLNNTIGSRNSEFVHYIEISFRKDEGQSNVDPKDDVIHFLIHFFRDLGINRLMHVI